MDCEREIAKRVRWISYVIAGCSADGVVLGNSGGKDCTLVLILCKMATPNVLSVIMPCESKRNYLIDREHALLVCEKYSIDNVEVDVSDAKKSLAQAVNPIIGDKVPMAYANMNPRLRMTVLYSIAQGKNYLVAGTGNADERLMGYFTKWGDGGHDFNPIADLTVSEIYEMLEYLDCPREIIDKAPSAGLYDGQTDEEEMGVSYAEIDKYIKTGKSEYAALIERAKARSEHKRRLPLIYDKDNNKE